MKLLLQFCYATSLDKFFILFASLNSAFAGATQPYMLILFGDITGIVIKYVEDSYDETLNVTQRQILADRLVQDGVNFATGFSIIGIVLTVTTYIASVLYAYSSVRQVRLI